MRRQSLALARPAKNRIGRIHGDARVGHLGWEISEAARLQRPEVAIDLLGGEFLLRFLEIGAVLPNPAIHLQAGPHGTQLIEQPMDHDRAQLLCLGRGQVGVEPLHLTDHALFGEPCRAY